MTNEALKDLIEEEAALQRWTGEGGSPQDPFGLMDRIQHQLQHQREVIGRAEGTSAQGIRSCLARTGLV